MRLVIKILHLDNLADSIAHKIINDTLRDFDNEMADIVEKSRINNKPKSK